MSRPSLVQSSEETVYLVLDDFGNIGTCYREGCAGETDQETVTNILLLGQFENHVRVIAFNVAEGWSKDVSADVAHELQRRSDLNGEDLSSTIENFVARHTADRQQFTLRLV